MADETYVRGEALHTMRQAGKEFVSMEDASRDIGHVLSVLKWMMDCAGEGLDSEMSAMVNQIATDYGVPRWDANY